MDAALSSGPRAFEEQLRAAVDDARAEMRVQVARAPDGRTACALLASAYDRVVSALWYRALERVPPAARSGMALVATGGWGRREVCPYSDIDFALVTRDPERPEVHELARALFYPMWDAGFKVGHSVREPHSTARLARADLATATALLDARLIVGSQELFYELTRTTRRALAPGGNANGFIERLSEEKARRHDRFGDSLYSLEPNLKHGIGGLRDLATGVWAAKARFGVRSLGELSTMGYLSTRRVAIAEGALDFLLALRCLVHATTGRPTDHLIFEIQEAIAPDLYPDVTLPAGDIRPAVAPAVEALMQQFYLHARGALQVSDRLLELAWAPARKKPRLRRIDATFLTFNGKLAVKNSAILRDRPSEMIRAFRVALDEDVAIYGHTEEIIAENIAARASDLTQDAECARHFVDTLVDTRDVHQPSLLERMHQLGLLCAVMPEFAPCTCRVQHDLYHVYTVDQHLLYTVAMLKRLARRELVREYPIATDAIARVERPRALYLAALLHDVGKPLGKGHAKSGARITRAVGQRLGLSADEIDTAAFLVQHHLTMPHLAQRRDLTDPAVIARFAKRVGDEERLRKLYLLSLCDTAMTAPGNLSAWKNELLRELFVRTRAHLRGGEEGGEARNQESLREHRERLVELLIRPKEGQPGRERAEIERFVAGIDERFFTALSPRQLARHVRLAWRYQESGQPVEISVAHYPLKGHSEVAVVAADVRGLLAAIAGAFTANRIDVLAAIIGPRHDDLPGAHQVALDIFYVRDLYGRAIPEDDPRWHRLHSDLAELLAGGSIRSGAVEALLTRKRSKSSLDARVTPGVPTTIDVYNDASEAATVVEVFTQDRVGVLHAITQALADMGLDIRLSKIATQGEEVADVFYVTDGETQGKVEDPAAIARLREHLLEALGRLGGE